MKATESGIQTEPMPLSQENLDEAFQAVIKMGKPYIWGYFAVPAGFLLLQALMILLGSTTAPNPVSVPVLLGVITLSLGEILFWQVSYPRVMATASAKTDYRAGHIEQVSMDGRAEWVCRLNADPARFLVPLMISLAGGGVAIVFGFVFFLDTRNFALSLILYGIGIAYMIVFRLTLPSYQRRMARSFGKAYHVA